MSRSLRQNEKLLPDIISGLFGTMDLGIVFTIFLAGHLLAIVIFLELRKNVSKSHFDIDCLCSWIKFLKLHTEIVMQIKVSKIVQNGTNRDGIKFTKYTRIVDTDQPKMVVDGMVYKFNSILINVEDLENETT